MAAEPTPSDATQTAKPACGIATDGGGGEPAPVNNMRIALLILLSLFICSCVTVTHLKSPEYETEAHKNHYPMDDIFYFNSAISKLEGSLVKVGAWVFNFENRTYIRYDIMIKNNTDSTIESPGSIEIYDSDNMSVRLLSPDEAVYYAHGITSQSALASSNALQAAATWQAYSNPSPINGYSYGNLYQTTPGNYSYGGSSYYYQEPNYAASMMGAMAVGMAMEASQIDYDLTMNRKHALYPTKLRPGISHQGTIYSLAAQLPLNLIISVAGEDHLIVLGMNKNTRGDRGGMKSRYKPKFNRSSNRH